jgi:competence protein ComGC
MTQDEWDSIQSMLCDNLDGMKDELPPDTGLSPSLPVGSTVDLPLVDDPALIFSDYSTVSTAQSIIAVPVTVRAAKCAVSSIKPVASSVVGGNGKIVISRGGVISQVVGSSKVKIQPKPLTAASPSLTAPHINGDLDKTPLVKTSNCPVVAVALPTLTPITTANTPQLSKLVPAPPTGSLSSSGTISTSLIDVRAVKRQQRMIKNRESACLSRKRKKDYMQSLEQQLQAYNMDNDRLRLENTALKRKVAFLQSENERLKRSPPVSKTSVTVMLCVVFVLSVNLLPFLQNFNSDKGAVVNTSLRVLPSAHTGRTLLSVGTFDSPESNVDVSADTDGNHRQMTVGGAATSVTGRDSAWKDVRDLVFGRHMDGATLNGRYICPTFFNSTESLRLVNELRGWVLGHEEELKRQQQLEMEQAKSSRPPKKYYAPRKLKAALRGAVELSRDLNSANKYEVQLFKARNDRYDHFLDAINRRNDTFYVVSFRHDHLLLPATAHNKTMRPRMSVMMPAVGLNETMRPPFGSIAMMQIDCEVTATRLVHIDKSAVPHHMLNQSSTGGQRSSHDDFHYEFSSQWAPPVSGGV